ncbi:hypothetical protein NA23_04315 [Fervidobacterium islandicum]|uniref:Uncharacterized protein n=1 Tax=Fervidobacterium islandicum TaxID=2423 RepID=A0AAI8CLG8_FERIS|nr:hypothetical protein [Fervidobacterium islandicum]AMW32579.1 hypothetical protein NA23_04315 [Fervidobacterium islandicum]
MGTLILSIVAAVTSFYLTKSYSYFSLILVGLYFTFRKNERAESLAGLNLLLISAVAILGKFRPYSLDGLNFVVYGTFLAILYDIVKAWYGLIPMLLLTGMGIGAIGAVKFGSKGYLLGLILIPVVLREYSLQRKLGGSKE